MELLQKHAQKIRFGAVGAANTALDFLILFILVALGLNRIPANYISTSIALIFSFFVNKSFTFKSKDKSSKKQFILFIVISLIGLWVIQPLIISGLAHAFAGTHWNSSVILFISKMVATVASLVWNYVFYSKLVFKVTEEKKENI